MQGGDPTGTGKGGKSFWGEPFRDEYSEKGAYKHDTRGVLVGFQPSLTAQADIERSMANSGPRSNTSQFFITFRPCPHLDGKHTVFGKLVGGEQTLDTIERIQVNPGSDRPTKPITITGVNVLSDPFEAYQTRLAAKLARQDQSDEAMKRREEAKREREKDRTTWLGTDLGVKGEGLKRKSEIDLGVGKYMGVGKKVAGGAGGVEIEFGEGKKKKKGGGFGDFSGW